ncbi:CoA transferase [Sphingomonas changnyeongensis]|uniref:CoA transferase n=1 Tax=Sphingomonas changnyeongensis TaxID=2698679 RepID=A0A7Z2NUX3_9SPHN|nr:CaiB/BaiF CoA-transferase family protein [Sphingomonas changnyeongensis]QHL89859.1 CoA transferase [Sphingomonas changnyeongensis]
MNGEDNQPQSGDRPGTPERAAGSPQQNAGRSGPLSGVRIVEFEGIGPVPLAAMILADMGADIVQLGRPGSQDPGAPVLDRGRTIVGVDLKSDAGRGAALDLLARADALLEGFRPGVMERLGLGPEAVHAVNPRLVYGRMTGWGQHGPMAPRAGHDLNYISLTGALHAIGRAGEVPPPPLNLIGDYGGGAMFLVAGVLAGLVRARTTGAGDVVDAAMTDGTINLLAMFHAFLASGRWQDRRQANLLDGATPFYRCYECADGRYVAVGCLEPQFYAALLAGLALDPAAWPQFDLKSWPAMTETFAACFKARDRDHWAAHFADTDACVTPVLSFAEAPDHPHNRARQSYVELGGVTQPAPAPRFRDAPSAARPAERIALEEALARWG